VGCKGNKGQAVPHPVGEKEEAEIRQNDGPYFIARQKGEKRWKG